jgi:Tfp pilus assembly protein PilN
MPIRINLLAETQAQEEMRRRDPVKRAIWVGAFAGALMLVWSSSLQLKAMFAKGELNKLQSELRSHTNEYAQVQESQKRLDDVNTKLGALRQLTANRLLNASILNALQRTTIEDVQLIRLKTEHVYALVEETKPKTNANRIIPGKPANITEKITLTLEAKDSGPNPGDQVNKFQEAIADCSYFQGVLGKTNVVRLTNIGTPQPGTEGNKPFVLFTLECRYPEKTR